MPMMCSGMNSRQYTGDANRIKLHKVNRAAKVNATYAFGTIDSHLQTIYDLSQQIDVAPNSKAAMDLNSRLVAEVAFIQTQELKMQVLLNQQLAQANAETLASQEASAKFNTLPDE